MLSLYPFVLATPCEGTKNILTEHFQNDIVAKKVKIFIFSHIRSYERKIICKQKFGH